MRHEVTEGGVRFNLLCDVLHTVEFTREDVHRRSRGLFLQPGSDQQETTCGAELEPRSEQQEDTEGGAHRCLSPAAVPLRLSLCCSTQDRACCCPPAAVPLLLSPCSCLPAAVPLLQYTVQYCPSLMIEADVIIRGHEPKEPIMAHPPDTDSDITLREWLEGVKEHLKGIKLDFKSMEAVSPSLVLLEEVLAGTKRPVWINADILSGPGGQARPLEPHAFLSAVTKLPSHTVLSLGWTTGWTAGTDNPGYSWDMVHVMEELCRDLKHPVTFPVRAALLAQSFSQLSWLLQQSHRYSLTVWTGQNDEFSLQDLLPYQEEFGMTRLYYDLPDPLRTQLTPEH